MNQLRNTLSTLLAVALVLCGAYAMGGVVARRVANREHEQLESVRIRHTQDELNEVRNEVSDLDKGHAAVVLGRNWVRD